MAQFIRPQSDSGQENRYNFVRLFFNENHPLLRTSSDENFPSIKWTFDNITTKAHYRNYFKCFFIAMKVCHWLQSMTENFKSTVNCRIITEHAHCVWALSANEPPTSGTRFYLSSYLHCRPSETVVSYRPKNRLFTVGRIVAGDRGGGYNTTYTKITDVTGSFRSVSTVKITSWPGEDPPCEKPILM